MSYEDDVPSGEDNLKPHEVSLEQLYRDELISFRYTPGELRTVEDAANLAEEFSRESGLLLEYGRKGLDEAADQVEMEVNLREPDADRIRVKPLADYPSRLLNHSFEGPIPGEQLDMKESGVYKVHAAYDLTLPTRTDPEHDIRLELLTYREPHIEARMEDTEANA